MGVVNLEGLHPVAEVAQLVDLLRTGFLDREFGDRVPSGAVLEYRRIPGSGDDRLVPIGSYAVVSSTRFEEWSTRRTGAMASTNSDASEDRATSNRDGRPGDALENILGETEGA
jgi:hypothetical protein